MSQELLSPFYQFFWYACNFAGVYLFIRFFNHQIGDELVEMWKRYRNGTWYYEDEQEAYSKMSER